jgi:hypothetical protein
MSAAGDTKRATILECDRRGQCADGFPVVGFFVLAASCARVAAFGGIAADRGEASANARARPRRFRLEN